MISPGRRRAQTVTTFVVGSFLLSLFLAYFLWREAFTVVLAVGGLVGALVILYEVRLTKRIAQAEFIRDLNDGFTSNANIDELWRKLLLGEPITPADRHRVSTYLTFFETMQLLIMRDVIDFRLIDDLFRNRFFTAVGDPGIQSTALIRDGSSFANIHLLIRNWHHHLRISGIRVPDGYYSYLAAMVASRGYELVELAPGDLEELLGLQEEALRDLRDEAWLRRNTPEMFADCLREHVVVGARHEGRLVAAAILFDGAEGPESIKRYVSRDAEELRSATNLKLVIVAPEHRRGGLGRTLVEMLEHRALTLGKGEVLCTVHPRNAPSRRLFTSLGYRQRAQVVTAYGRRRVLSLRLRRGARRALV